MLLKKAQTELQYGQHPNVQNKTKFLSTHCFLMNLTESKFIFGGCKINKYLDFDFKNSNLKIPTLKPRMRKFVIYSLIMLVNTSYLSYLLVKSGAVVTFFSTIVKAMII